MSKKDLKVTMIGDDKTGKAFKSAGDGAGKMVKAFAVAGAAAGAAVGVFVAKGVKDAMQLETSLREVNSLFGLSGKAGAESFKELQSGVKGVSKEVGIAQDTLTKGLYTAISAGVPKENAFTFLADAAKLGIAGVADTETAVNALTGVMNAFQADNLTSAQAADLLFTTVRQGKTTLAELAPAIGTVGPAAAAAGVSFEETAAALASVTKIIPNTATAASSLRAVFGEADKSGTKFNDSLKSLGANTMGEAIKKFGSFQGVLQAVYEQSGSNDVAFKNLFGSVEAGGAALTMVGTNASVAAADLAAMKDSTGNADTAFQEMNKSVARNVEQLKVTFQNLGIEVGNKVLPLINQGVTALSDWWAVNGPAVSAAVVAMKDQMIAAFTAIGAAIRGVVTFFREHETTAKAVGVVVAAVAGTIAAAWVAQAAVATINAAKSVIAWLATATASTTSKTIQSKSTAQIVVGWGVHAAKAAFHAAKVVVAWVATSAGAIKAAGVMVAQTAVHVAKWAFLGAQSLLHAAKVAAAWLIAMGPIGLVIAAVAGLVIVVIKNWDTIREKTVALWNAVKSATAAAWEWIKGAVSAAVGFVTKVFLNFTGPGLIIKHWATIKSTFTAGVAAIKATISAGVGAVVSTISGLPGKITGALGNMGGLLLNAGKSIVDGLIRGITSKFGALARKAKELAQKVKDFLPFSPAKRGPFAGKGNPYYSGLSIGRLVEDGLDKSLGGVVDTMQRRLSDAGDLTGMKVGGASYVNGRLAATAGRAPVEPAAKHLTVVLQGQVEKIDEARLVTLLQRAERLAGF